MSRGKSGAHPCALALLALGLLAGAGTAVVPAAPETALPRTILDLQAGRRVETVPGGTGGDIRLTALNPASNAWFVLETGAGGQHGPAAYHIENPDPAGQQVHLTAEPSAALVISRRSGIERCAPWQGAAPELQTAAASGLPYARVCGGRLYLRNRVAGSRTNLERITNLLRDHVWGGDEIVGWVKDTFFTDSFVEAGEKAPATAAASVSGPAPASIDPSFAGQGVDAPDLGIALTGRPSGMGLGAWYAAAGMPGVYVAAIQPKALPQGMLHGSGTNPLDDVESAALDYLVAFDLSQFELRFALGTDHPRVGWSPRVPAQERDSRMPGPDGIGTVSPLVNVGMVSPLLAGRTMAAFTGGFKREHGAFKYGDLSIRNHGSHYGFIEQGVVFSSMQPDLATLLVLDDGTVQMKTWTTADDALLPRIRFARQNGVALLEASADGRTAPGARVTKWGPGNWSGSASEQLRTLRAGACLQETAGRRFLVYGYFSTATPSAMAHVFQAFGCSYAMLLDMNALEHTYLALYVRGQGKLQVEHLIRGMQQVDKTSSDGKPIPRFIGFPDNRDFFYLLKRETTP